MLIELVIIGAVVYWVVSFLQGTRGARLLKGIAFLLVVLYVVVSLLAGRFGLERVKFLYERFLLAAGFAIIVVFQPELRRALMRLGEEDTEKALRARPLFADYIARRGAGR